MEAKEADVMDTGLEASVSNREGHDLVEKLLIHQNGPAASGAKQVPLLFHNMSVSVPAQGPIVAKTLPKAVMTTFGIDQFNWCKGRLQSIFSSRQIRGPARRILNDCSGYVEPGEMLFVLGRPGSGCSTFLRAAANKSQLSVSGDVRYSNKPASDFAKNHRRETIYLPEEDKHIAALSVRETVRFALRMSLPAKDRKSLPLDELVVTMARMFGLEGVLDTPVGGAFFPGVSGGERKRVSIAEVLASGSTVQCFDNSTRGLDSSTALDFVKALRLLTDVGQKTTLATLYQAGENIYERFDKVLVLQDGHEVFFGPTNQARAYFEDLGFVYQQGQTTSEFLTTVTDPSQRIACNGTAASDIRTAEQLAQAFKRSTQFQALQKDINAAQQVSTDLIPTSHYNLSYPIQIFECFKREWILTKAQRRIYYTKWITTVILSLVCGSEYFDIQDNAQGAYTRGGIILFALILNGWQQFPELFSAHTNRPILERQAALAMYRPSSVALARIIIDIPLITVQHAFFMISFYFLARLQVDAGKFFYFYFVLLLSTINFSNLLRLFAYYVPTLDDCFRYGGTASTITVIFCGYLIPAPEMRPYFGWLHWISPLYYAYEALSVSEFAGRTLTCDSSELLPSVSATGIQNQVCPIRGATPGQQNVPGLDYLATYGFQFDHRWRNVGILIGIACAYMFASALGSEIMQFTPQGGIPVVFTKRPGAGQMNTTFVKEDPERSGSESPPDSESALKTRPHYTGPSLTWRNLEVSIGEKHILKGISGYVRPGDFIALCGASGAGKTTMLTALSQTNFVGTLEGQVRFGGRPLDKSFKKVTGFAQQQDLHEGTATVREAFEFSALLRQPDTYSRSEKLAYVDRVLEMLDLTHLQHALIGDEETGLGVEQKKRVTIGVELAARPKILFADEPTSGLDSQGAVAIVGYLSRLAQSGQAVLVTIHQPSASLFNSFDKLLALSSEGRQLYFGPVRSVISYLAERGAVAPPDANPAEFVLETVGAGINNDSSAKSSAWAETWRDSDEARRIADDIEVIESNFSSDSTGGVASDTSFNASTFTQTYLLTQRMLKNQWRQTAYAYSKLWVHIIQALLLGFTFYQLGTSPQELQNRALDVFALLFLVNTIVNTILARFFFARLFWEFREGPSYTYSWITLCSASILAEVPGGFLCGVVYYLLWYFLSGLPLGQPAGYTFLFILTYELFEILFGLFMMAMSPDLGFAGNVLVFLVATCNWFNGIVVPYSQIQVFWRYWMYYLNPFTYLFGGLVKAAVENQPVACSADDIFHFAPPAGQSCVAYAGAWAREAGAQLLSPESMADCSVCQYTSGTQYLQAYNLGPGGLLNDNLWAFWAVFLLFTLSSLMLVYFFTWATKVRGWKLFYFF